MAEKRTCSAENSPAAKL